MEYTPKIIPSMVLAGYTGSSPNVAAAIEGYLKSVQTN